MKYKMQYHIYLKLQSICEPLGLKVENEVTLDPHDLLFGDIVIKEKKLIVEVDGAHHFLFGDKDKMLEVDKLNRKLFEGLGYQVKSINIDEYDQLKPEDKETFLTNLIK